MSKVFKLTLENPPEGYSKEVEFRPAIEGEEVFDSEGNIVFVDDEYEDYQLVIKPNGKWVKATVQDVIATYQGIDVKVRFKDNHHSGWSRMDEDGVYGMSPGKDKYATTYLAKDGTSWDLCEVLKKA